jgi:DNA primase
MPSIDLQQVRRIIPISDVLDLLGFVAVARSGSQVRGACPLHESTAAKSRVFSVHLTKNTFQCFKCKAAGNQLDLWTAARKQPIYKAAMDLCARMGHSPPILQSEQRRGTRRQSSAST